ncbi:citrate synthase-like protein [Podospora appendiculata]|uniref:Citrate synthase n=1 Tax=Podospora appendiculata TaxID=314037 RepID=A0AAE0XGR2_9PEZI|nr:citrate synthase-like protein [Podospora appendiculata]
MAAVSTATRPQTAASSADQVNVTVDKQDVLHAVDGRTGLYYAIPISKNSIRALDLRKIKSPNDAKHPAYQNEQGLRVYDPGFSNTCVSESKITYIDGLEGTIQYRGYSIHDIYGKKKWIDISHLLIWGTLPSPEEAKAYQDRLNAVPLLDEHVLNVIRAFPTNGSITGMMIAGLSALQSVNLDTVPAHVGENLYVGHPERVDAQIIHLLQSFAMIAGACYCHYTSREFTQPRPELSYIENFLLMTGHVDAATGLPNPRHVEALERLWVVVADHEMTCSTAAFLHTASSLPDVISCFISAISAATGPLHGGAIAVAYKHIKAIGTVEDVPAKIARVKAGKELLYGYGHRVYRTTDPRFTYISQVLDGLSEEVGRDPLLRVALALDKAASEDEYFTSRKLFPNADLFAAFAYQALGFPPEFVLPISCLSRLQGLTAHWKEGLQDKPKIWRPGQIYTGELEKPWTG